MHVIHSEVLRDTVAAPVVAPPLLRDADTTELGVDELDDHQLIDLARDGSPGAYAELYHRYSYVALRLARHLSPQSDAEDIVAEAFAQVWAQLRKGNGPREAFRSYLLATVRHESGRRAKLRQRVQPTDDERRLDSAEDFVDPAVHAFENDAVRAAFESLNERWRQVLWSLDVEGRKPQEVADALGIRANTVSALAYRARAALREAYVQHHLGDAAHEGADDCTAARALMAGAARDTLSRRDRTTFDTHLDECASCVGLYLEIGEVSSSVAGVFAGAPWVQKIAQLAKAVLPAAEVQTAVALLSVAAVTLPTAYGDDHRSPVPIEQAVTSTVTPAAEPSAEAVTPEPTVGAPPAVADAVVPSSEPESITSGAGETTASAAQTPAEATAPTSGPEAEVPPLVTITGDGISLDLRGLVEPLLGR